MRKRLWAILIVLIMVATFVPFQAIAALAWTDVSNFAQLKTALESATVTHIRLAGDIEIEKKGVTINPSKSELVIDGDGYTLTTYNSSASTDTLRLAQNKTLKNITVQNINVVGYNWYGIVHIPDSTTYKDITLTYDNMTYAGPQLIAARKSTAIIRDCDIRLIPGYSKHSSEVAAASDVRLEGTVNIVKEAPACKMEMFHISNKGGGLTVASGAVVNVEDNLGSNRTKDYGFIYVPYNNQYIRFEDDSKFNYIGNNVFQKGEEVDDIYIGKRAEVKIETYGDFYCENSLFAAHDLMTVEEDATLILLALGNNKEKPVVWLDHGANLVMNSPKEVLIYNNYAKSSKAGLAIKSDGCKETAFTVNNVESLEYWSMNTSPYDALPAPTKGWSNPDGSLFSMSVTQKEKTTKSCVSTGYTGSTPLNTTTATLNNVNVIRVNGGFAQNESTVIVKHLDIATGNPLKGDETFSVPRGAYAYEPADDIAGYAFDSLAAGSAPASGIINAGETKTIIFLYRTTIELLDIEGVMYWDDYDNISNTRPATVGIELYRNGVYFDEVWIDSSGNGEFSFIGVDKVDEFGTPYVYTIGLIDTGMENYGTEITGSVEDGFVVTNKLFL